MTDSNSQPELGRKDNVPGALELMKFLEGTWRFLLAGEYPGTGWLHFTDDGLAVQFVVFDSEPRRRNPQRFWYEVRDPDTLWFRPRPDDEGCPRNFLRRSDSSFLLGSEATAVVCDRLAEPDFPDWLDEALKQQLTKFL